MSIRKPEKYCFWPMTEQPVGKRALYRLTMLAIKEGDIAEAEAYYREYIEISPQDSRKYLMEYHIAVAKG